jgi:glycerol-3-phosphate acyltransferase PlsY
MLVQTVLLIVGSYLLGSIPMAYLVGRWFKGIDLRQYGSGTVSGSMVYEHVARWVVVPVGLFDMGKAALPTWLGLRLGLGLEVATAAGLAAAVGHNWPIFLRFRGGRGLGCLLGILLVLYPWGTLWLLGFLTIGWLLGDSAPFALVSLISLPLPAHFLGGPDLVLLTIGALLLTLGKRLEANRRPLPPPGPERRHVIWRRLIFDRDIASHEDWIHRRPEAEGEPN